MELVVTTFIVIWFVLGFLGSRLIVGKPKNQFECFGFFLLLLSGPIIFLFGIGTFIIAFIYDV